MLLVIEWDSTLLTVELTLLRLTGGETIDCLDFLLDEFGVILVIFTFTGGGGGGGGPNSVMSK